MTGQYSPAFYEKQSDGSVRSAARVVPLVMELAGGLQSVVDVGCGVGAFLAEFAAHGVGIIEGVDGAYIDRTQLRIPDGCFRPHDLCQPLILGRRFDLAASLEVAEHLPAARAQSFVEDLTQLSDLVLFSAAIPGQGGTHHVNEQWQDYWANEFHIRGYQTIDAIRPRIWDLEEVESWYRQNTLLYANLAALERYPGLLSNRVSALVSLCVVHPKTWMAHPSPGRFLKTAGQAIPIYVRKAGERWLGMGDRQ